MPVVDEPELPRDLGDGLLLRRATAADAETLAVFNKGVHAAPSDEVVAVWTRDLLRGDHPARTHEHVLVIEDTRAAEIASTACLIEQTWTYAGIPFLASRPELIGTAPAYRRRGLVRALFDVLHAWGERRGHRLQFITGIPNYYRQFGYEPTPAVTRFVGPVAGIPPLPDETAEPYRLRPATEADLPFVAQLAEQADRRSLLAGVRDAALWRYELFGRHPGSDYTQHAKVIETPAGEPVGLVVHWSWVQERKLETILYEVVPGHSWSDMTPRVLRGLHAAGEALAAAGDANGALDSLGFTCDADHPIVRLHPTWLTKARRDFHFYTRIADIPAFLRLVAPVLENRLAASPLAGYTGGLEISFYRDGVNLGFEEGRLVDVRGWQPSTESSGDAALPGLTFLQILLGSRSLAELEDAFPDCLVAADRARALVTALFPKEASTPWPIG